MLGDFMNKNDLRYIKTEKIIKETFKKCVTEHGFEKVTVSMICEKGLISRNAFYLHFTDKFDLLDRLFDEFRSSLLKKYGKDITKNVSENNIFASAKLYAETLIENREDFLFLMKCSRNKMEEIIQEIIIDFPNKEILPNYDKICENINIRLNKRYMFTAMVAYTELWFENFDNINKDEAIFELYKLCETPTTIFQNYINK